MDEQFQETKKQKVKRFFRECWRVLRVTRKPNKQEYLTAAKVSALGMAIIGLIGFLITIIKQLLF